MATHSSILAWRREWQPTPVSLPGESHGQRSLASYSPWGRKNSNMTERLKLSLSFLLNRAKRKPRPRVSQFSSVTQLCPTLCNPMNCITPGIPVHHQLLEFTQTHVHRVGDAIQPSHPVVPFFSCPQSLPASGSFPISQLFA